MLTQEEIDAQFKLLNGYRQNLLHFIEQAMTYGGEAYAPLPIPNHIAEQRRQIQRIKSILRSHDVIVDDGLNDGAPSQSAFQLQPLPRQQRARLFISYKRNTHPDEPLAMYLRAEFERAGHEVFIDQTMKVGTEWLQEIIYQIENCDFMLVLLSGDSVRSEMLVREVEAAYRRSQASSKACILPIRVNYTDALPYQLSHYLDSLHYAEWYNETSNSTLIRNLLEAIGNRQSLPRPINPPTQFASSNASPMPLPHADPRFLDTLEDPTGAVPFDSEFYIKRDGDDMLEREMRKRLPKTITIRAAHQTGKTSLLIRGVKQARALGKKVVHIDLQPVDDSCMHTLDVFLKYLMRTVVSKLRLDVSQVEKGWRGDMSPNDKANWLMEDYILPEANGSILLALDEVDRLLRTSFYSDFFALLRSWHNLRASNELWDTLDIMMVIATEPHLLIQDVNQSPFNVGTKIRLKDFNEAQVCELNQRYRTPLNDTQIPCLMQFLSGHPYLTRKALYTLLNEDMNWEQLVGLATTPNSPFWDHLRSYLMLLRDQPELKASLRQVIERGKCSDETSYYRLFRAGLVKGDDYKQCVCRCQLYEHYFKDKLA